MIDTSNWKEFKLSDIGFENYHGSRQKQADREDGDIPLLTAGKENQGVAAYISNPLCCYEDAITVDMFGNSFYHKGVYAGDDNIYFFVNSSLSDEAKVFIASILNAENTRKYAFKEQFRQPQANALTVKLPVTSEGTPDWGYMESYMKSIMEESEKSLENLKKTNNQKYQIDTSNWKEFKIEDLFDIKLPSARSEKNYSEGDIRYVSSGAFNNGVANYLEPKSNETLDRGHCITVSPLDGASFWQDEDFMGRGGSGASISMLYNDNLNELRALFVCSVIRNTAQRFGYSNLLNSTNLKTLELTLPATPDGSPDWQYMESYMRDRLEEAEKVVAALN